MIVNEPASASQFGHTALLYETSGELAEGIAAFVAAGVGAGEPVLVDLPEARLRALQAQLDVPGRNVTWRDTSADPQSPGKLIDRVRSQAAQHPGRPFRYAHEPAQPGQPVAELCEVIRHEALVNTALAGVPANVLCAYDGCEHRQLAAGVRWTHPEVISRGQRRPCASYRRGASAPPEFDQPLSPVPAAAARLTYRDDQGAARRFTAAHARRAGLPESRVDDLVLAVSELTVNTRAHTAGTGTLAIWTAPGRLLCQVTDSGHITNPLRRPGRPRPGGGGSPRPVDRESGVRLRAAQDQPRRDDHPPAHVPVARRRHRLTRRRHRLDLARGPGRQRRGGC